MNSDSTDTGTSGDLDERITDAAGVDIVMLARARDLMIILGGRQRTRDLLHLMDRFNVALQPMLHDAALGNADGEMLCLVLIGVAKHVFTASGAPPEQWSAIVQKACVIDRVIDWGNGTPSIEVVEVPVGATP